MTTFKTGRIKPAMPEPSKPKRGGKRPGSGRKPGAKNKTSVVLKAFAGQYSEEAVLTLVNAMRDPDAPQSVRIQAADKLLDRSHGRPAVHLEPIELNIPPIPWEALREITRQSIEKSLRYHQEFIETRYARLGIERE